jgi:hypothetical protein
MLKAKIVQILFSQIGKIMLKAIYLIHQKWLEKNLQKNYKKYPSRYNYEVCRAVARCFPNILDVMVLEYINLS